MDGVEVEWQEALYSLSHVQYIRVGGRDRATISTRSYVVLVCESTVVWWVLQGEKEVGTTHTSNMYKQRK